MGRTERQQKLLLYLQSIQTKHTYKKQFLNRSKIKKTPNELQIYNQSIAKDLLKSTLERESLELLSELYIHTYIHIRLFK